MKIPKEVRLHNVVIKVKIIKDLTKALEDEGILKAGSNKQIFGLADLSHQQILLEKEQGKELMIRHFYHELAHFLDWFANLNINEEKTQMLADCIQELVETKQLK